MAAAEVNENENSEKYRVAKWDAVAVKYAIDDIVKKVINDKLPIKERHSLTDGRLLLSFIAVVFSGIAIAYDYIHPFPGSKWVLASCAGIYFLLMVVLQFYIWYVEGNTFYQGVEKVNKKDRYWNWSSELKRADDRYTLIASYQQNSDYGRYSISKSVGSYITEDDHVVPELLEKDIVNLYEQALDERKKK